MAQNNLELRLARTRTAETAGLARQAAAYPNPTATATYEPVFRGDDAYGETYLNLSQRIEWPGLRRARSEAAEEIARSARAQVQADSLRLAFEVAEAYVQAAAAEERLRVLQGVTEIFRRADQSRTAMLAEGEVSGYDVRRLRVERARYENLLALAELDARSMRRRLALLVLPDEEAIEVGPSERQPMMPVRLTLDAALERARIRRAELASAQAQVDAAQAAFDLARKERLPEPTLTAGYKHQSDGFAGVFLGTTVPLPVFDRNRGAIAAQEARLRTAETRLILTERQVENDVRRAYDAYASLAERVDLLSRDLLAEADELLTAARVSYSEGEMSLVELLDAAEAYRDARVSSVELLSALQVAYYDLLRASGGVTADLTSSTTYPNQS